MPDIVTSSTSSPNVSGSAPTAAGRGSAARGAAGHPIVDISGGPVAENPAEVTRLTVVELRVRNHPGTMSHITGLFARRAFNLEAILCVPEGGRATSRVLLLVTDDPKLEQIERQLAKLHDVLEVRHRPEIPAAFFQQLRW